MKTWGIYVVVVLGFIIYGAATKVDRDNPGTIVGKGNIDAFQIKVGDCFDDASSIDDEVTDLPGVPCSKPHDNETFAVFDLSITTYPKGDAMGELVGSVKDSAL